jgi:hypothetical protein
MEVNDIIIREIIYTTTSLLVLSVIFFARISNIIYLISKQIIDWKFNYSNEKS